MQLSIELILGIIGTITGVLALAIQYFHNRSYIPCLKISYNERNSMIIHPEEFQARNYQTDRSCLVNIEINNISAMPTTIQRISLGTKPAFSHDSEFKVYPPQIPLGNGMYKSIKIEPALDLPLRIEAYDSIYGSLRFPFIPDGSSFTVYLETPIKTYSLKVKLEEYRNLMSRLSQ